MNDKLRSILIGFLISTKITFSFVTFFWPETAYLSTLSEEGILKLNNEERESKNLAVLSYEGDLEHSAKEKAGDMIENGYFAHDSPGGITPWYWFKKNGYKYVFAGENLAIDFISNNSVHEAWMNSETHRENILNPHFQDMGVGIVSGLYKGKITTIVVTHFGTRNDANSITEAITSTVRGTKTSFWDLEEFSLRQIINIIYISILLILAAMTIYSFYKKSKEGARLKASEVIFQLVVMLFLIGLIFI